MICTYHVMCSVLAEDAIKAALKDYKLKQEKLRDASTEEAVAQ